MYLCVYVVKHLIINLSPALKGLTSLTISNTFYVATPGKPTGPLGVSNITKSTCHLKWKAPKDDGGSKITHYQVEKREVGKPFWSTVASFCKVCQLAKRLLSKCSMKGHTMFVLDLDVGQITLWGILCQNL